MSGDLAEIRAQILDLNPNDKTTLIRTLIADLDHAEDGTVDAAWLQEAERRHRELATGRVTPVAGQQVFEHIRTRLKRQ